MIDPREAVAKEFAARVFSLLFIRPKGWTDDQAAEHVGMCFQAVRPHLPRDRPEALALTRGAELRLKAEAKTNAWPTVREVLDAVRAERGASPADGGDDKPAWPHANSEYVIESTARWVRRFGVWPAYLEHAGQVAQELVARGDVTERELLDAGYGPAVDRMVDADRARAAAYHARQAAADCAMPQIQATPAAHASGGRAEGSGPDLPPHWIGPESDELVAQRVRARHRAARGPDVPCPEVTPAMIAAYREREGISRPGAARVDRQRLGDRHNRDGCRGSAGSSAGGSAAEGMVA